MALDRRREWDKRMKERGFKRVNMWVPSHQVELVKEVKELLLRADSKELEELAQFFRSAFEHAVEHEELDDDVREWVVSRIHALSSASGPQRA